MSIFLFVLYFDLQLAKSYEYSAENVCRSKRANTTG